MRHLILFALLSLGCSPALEPLTKQQPLAVAATAGTSNVIWLLDKSGSMNGPIDPNSPDCPAGCGNTSCPVTCVTRRDALLDGLSAFRSLPGGINHQAVLFPTDPRCGAPDTSTSSNSFSGVLGAYYLSSPTGGTPTAATLQFAKTLLDPARDNFVVLVTDGFPNCNSDNPHNICSDQSEAQVALCQCTTGSCSTTFCSTGCMDELGVVSASQELASLGAALMVIGFGADLVNHKALSAMRIDVSDCGEGSDAGCDPVFYAPNSAAFTAPVTRLTSALSRVPRCSWWLDHNVTTTGLTVTIDGTATSDYTLAAANHLVLNGATCAAMLTSTSSPVVTWTPQ